MLMTCARATDPSIYKAMYDGLLIIFPEINCGGCDDEMLLNVGNFPQDVDSKGRLLPLRKCGPLRQRQSPSHQELEPQCSNGRPRAPDHQGRRGPRRAPAYLSTDESTVAGEVAVADRALDFWDVIYYDGGSDWRSRTLSAS
jgi:hypothetical protein